MTIEEIKKFIEEAKETDEVKSFLAELSKPAEVTPELFKKFIETDDGKVLIQPYGDQRATEAVKTRDKFWEKERLEPEVKKRVAAEVLKLNPQKEPWQLEIEQLKADNEKEKKERAKDQLKRQIVEKAASMQIDPFFIEDFLPNTAEEAELYLKKIAERDKKIMEKTVNDLIASKKFVPNGKVEKETKIDKSNLTLAEAIKLEEEGKLDD